MEHNVKPAGNNVYKQWLVFAYLENPADFPKASNCLQLSVTNHATAHTLNVGKHIKKLKTILNKIPGIKILIALPILFLGFLFLLSRPWDNPTMKEIYFEKFQSQKVGFVEKTELWKGCGLSIEFENPDRKYISFNKDTSSFSIGSDCEINEQIHRKDFFQKLPKSNKCFIIRNDSVMLFDCDTDLDLIIEKFKIPISEINGWNLNRNYEWFKLPYPRIEKYLKKEYYEKNKIEK